MIHFKSVVPSMHQYLVPFDGGYTVGELKSFYSGFLQRCMGSSSDVEWQTAAEKDVFDSFKEWLKMGRMICRKGGKDIPIFFYVNLNDGRSLAFKPVIDHTVCPIDFMIGCKTSGKLRRTAIVNLCRKVESANPDVSVVMQAKDEQLSTALVYENKIPKVDYDS